MDTCNAKCEVFSRIVGYYRPVDLWNTGKREEFKFRKEFTEEKALNKELIATGAQALPTKKEVKNLNPLKPNVGAPAP